MPTSPSPLVHVTSSLLSGCRISEEQPDEVEAYGSTPPPYISQTQNSTVFSVLFSSPPFPSLLAQVQGSKLMTMKEHGLCGWPS